MNAQEYIDSGLLQDYCLGMLSTDEMSEVDILSDMHPEVKMELQRIQARLEQYAEKHRVEPPEEMKDSIWATLRNINKEKEMDPDDLPFINRFTDHTHWVDFVQSKIPGEITEDRVVTVLQQNALVTQMLVISKTDFDNEEHEHELESFVILEGECECTVGDNVFRLGPGGFTEIPLYTPHAVRIVSPYVVAILQRVAV